VQRHTSGSTRQIGPGVAMKIRVDQNPEVQEESILALISQRGWSTHRVYSDRASGAKKGRPGLNALMVDAQRGLF
jgi:DNA invertase Pin-like site-specific DNA recombinase